MSVGWVTKRLCDGQWQVGLDGSLPGEFPVYCHLTRSMALGMLLRFTPSGIYIDWSDSFRVAPSSCTFDKVAGATRDLVSVAVMTKIVIAAGLEELPF